MRAWRRERLSKAVAGCGLSRDLELIPLTYPRTTKPVCSRPAAEILRGGRTGSAKAPRFHPAPDKPQDMERVAADREPTHFVRTAMPTGTFPMRGTGAWTTAYVALPRASLELSTGFRGGGGSRQKKDGAVSRAGWIVPRHGADPGHGFADVGDGQPAPLQPNTPRQERVWNAQVPWLRSVLNHGAWKMPRSSRPDGWSAGSAESAMSLLARSRTGPVR